MLSFSVPFYGHIRSLAVDPQDNTLWAIYDHPEGKKHPPQQIKIQEILDTQESNASVVDIDHEGRPVDVLGHKSGLYIASAEGTILRYGRSSEPQKCFEIDADFGLQGIVSFRDGRAKYPKTEIKSKVFLPEAQSNDLFLIIGQRKAVVAQLDATGMWVVLSEIEPFQGDDKAEITAWAAETVFSEAGQSHHCVFGLSTGAVVPYFTKSGQLDFQETRILSPEEIPYIKKRPAGIVANDQLTLSDGPVNALIYVREIDRYQNEIRYLVVAGADQKVHQVALLESIAIPRNPRLGHSKQIRAFIPGCFASGDGAYQAEYFGRFYSLGRDQNIKTWGNKYDTLALSGVNTGMSLRAGCIMILPTVRTSGAYSEGAFTGKTVPTPFLVVGGDEGLAFFEIVKYDRGSVDIDDLRKNGRIEKIAHLQITGGKDFVQDWGVRHSSDKVRRKSLERFGTWNIQWIVDQLYQITSNARFPFAYRERALDFIASSPALRRVVILEDLLQNDSEDIQELAYDYLKKIFSDSLRAHELTIEKASVNTSKSVIRDLAEIAVSASPLKRQALQELQGLIQHRTLELAQTAYYHLVGQGERLTDGSMRERQQVMSGVDGILFGIYSNHIEVRREMALILQQRNLLSAFETSLVLRRMLEEKNKDVRMRALDVSFLRAPQLAKLVRSEDKFLHKRLCALEYSDKDTREQAEKTAFTRSELNSTKQLFINEDPSIYVDRDLIVELTACSKDDVAIYALLAKAALGYEGALQGLLQLTKSKNADVLRAATVGLGFYIENDEAFQRVCELALSSNTEAYIRIVALRLGIRGYDVREQDPVQGILTKMLNSGSAEIRRIVVTITQKRVKARVEMIKSFLASPDLDENAAVDQKRQDLLKQYEEAREGLRIAKELNNQTMIQAMLDEVKELEDLLEELPEKTNTLASHLVQLRLERDLLVIVLNEETIDETVRGEVYKTYYKHNLENVQKGSDKTDTLKRLLCLRDRVLFNKSLLDLSAHIALSEDRNWALKLFEGLVNKNFKPDHFSNVWSIWTQIANDAKGKTYEEHVLHVGFNCKLRCRCERNIVCERHQIRRDAFRRILSANGDWLAQYILQALGDTDDNSRHRRNDGHKIHLLAASRASIDAVDRLSDSEDFVNKILIHLDSQRRNEQLGMVRDILSIYPKYCSERIKTQLAKYLSHDPIFSLVLSDKRYLNTEIYESMMSDLRQLEGQNTKALELFAIENGYQESFCETFFNSKRSQLQAIAIQLASGVSEEWSENMLEEALYDHNEGLARIAFNTLLKRAEAKGTLNDDSAKREFLEDYFRNAVDSKKVFVLETLKISRNTPDWVQNLFSEMLTNSTNKLREQAYRRLQSVQNKDPWIIDVFKSGLLHSDPQISDISFQVLYQFNQSKGEESERTFLTETMKRSRSSRERAIVAGLETTGAWRAQFIADGLNDEDSVIRGLVCEQLRGISDISDSFLKGLLEHQYEDVRDFATEVLIARGLYRPASSPIGKDLKRVILEAPPRMPDRWRSWIAWSNWYWKVRHWRDRKITAIRSAGKTHSPDFFPVFQKLLGRLGYNTKLTELWSDAIRYTAWSSEDWWEFIALETGWVLSQSTLSTIQREEKNVRSNRMRVAWNVALMRFGQYDSLKWLVDQYYGVQSSRRNRYDHNHYKSYIKLQYIYEGLFAVESFVADGKRKEGPAYAFIQRFMNEQPSMCPDLFRLNMLRLSCFGGPVDFIASGLTCADQRTNLEAAFMRQHSYSKRSLLNGLEPLLNNEDLLRNDPYKLANTGGNWYQITKLLFELNTFDVNRSRKTPLPIWKDLSMLLSVDDSKLRARGVIMYFRRHSLGERKSIFEADVSNYARQLEGKTVYSQALRSNGNEPTMKEAHELAFEAFVSLIRKTDFAERYRRDALRYLVTMRREDELPELVLPILNATLSMGSSPLRWESYGFFIALQAAELKDKLSLEHVIQMGLRSTDLRLKKAAISLIWVTDQLTLDQKISRLESIIQHVADKGSEYAFELLYAFAGRPKAWDDADRTQSEANAAAKAELDRINQSADSEGAEAKAHFEAVAEALRQSNQQNLLNQRQAELNEKLKQLDVQKSEAAKAYEAALKSAEDAHKGAMTADLSASDLEALGARFARRDALLEMAIHSYHSDLRSLAVTRGVLELARRRPYFEAQNEEYVGYFEQLHAVLKSALESPYSELRHLAAMSMAKSKFVSAYPVLLGYLDSHDPSEQADGIQGLVQLGQAALTSFKDANGNSYPRTAVIFLARIASDEYGTVLRAKLFNAIAELRDRHPTVVEPLFKMVDEGPSSPDFSYAMNALIGITNCQKTQYLSMKKTAWEELTVSHFEELSAYLPRQLDWERLSISECVELYEMVVDEVLLAQIIDALVMVSDYSSISRYGLLELAKRTQGFDIKAYLSKKDEKLRSLKQPIDAVVSKLASLKESKGTLDIRNAAIQTLVYRLYNQDKWVPEARQEAIQSDSQLIESLQLLIHNIKAADAVPEWALGIAEALASTGNVKGDSVFKILYKVSTQDTYQINWRVRAMRSLGRLSDERSVVAMLKAAGYDAFGEQLASTASESDSNQLKLAALEALGGMIFAQESEAIFQLVSGMTRSRYSDSQTKGYQALRYFSRSEKHAFEVASLLAERFQAAMNSNRYTDQMFFSELLSELLTPMADEDKHRKDPRSQMLMVTPDTEAQLKQYILQTIYGEPYLMDGEVYKPLSIRNLPFDTNHSDVLELVYKTARELVHGAHREEDIIQLSYLSECSAAECYERLKPEIALFKNRNETSYSVDVTRYLAEFLPVEGLFDLILYTQDNGFLNGHQALVNRADAIWNALVYRKPAPIAESLTRFKEDYIIDNLDDYSPAKLYTPIVMAILAENEASLNDFRAELLEQMLWFFGYVDKHAKRFAFGAKASKKYIDHFFGPLKDLITITAGLSWDDAQRKTLAGVLEQILKVCTNGLGLDTAESHQVYTFIFRAYLELGAVDWSFVSEQLRTQSRQLRVDFVSWLTPALAGEMTPTVISWLLDDNASLIRLADVLSGHQEVLLSDFAEKLAVSGQPAGSLLLLSRLESLELFKSTIDLHRDKEDASISDAVGLRDSEYRVTLDTVPKLSVEALMRGVSLLGTAEAEDYLRMLAQDERLGGGLRRVAKSCAGIAFRKRLPVHIRRTMRQQASSK